MKKSADISLFVLLVALSVVAAGRGVAGSFLASVNTDQAHYAPGSTVKIIVSLTNNTKSRVTNGSVRLDCKHLDEIVATLPTRSVTLASGAAATLTFLWTPPRQDFQGYAVEVWARSPSGGVIDNMNTAVDVSSTWTRFPRYGYVSAYPRQSTETSFHTIRQLKNFHINAVQFYDWQHKHDVPLAGTPASPADSWTNLTNGTNYRQTVLDEIKAAHTYGMSAMDYNLLYGAWDGYGDDGVDYHWGLWNSNNGTRQESLPMPSGWATPKIDLFNPANTAWQNYLFTQEANVFAAYPFDGWQVDQVGDRGKKYDYSGKPVDVWMTFRPFLNAAKTRLSRKIIFNNVDGYGLYDTAANATEDALYIE